MIRRHKNRYLLVEASVQLNIRIAEPEIIRSITAEMGSIGCLEANPKIVHQFNDSVFIMRTNRGSERRAVLAFAFAKTFMGQSVGFYTIKTSGTIRSLVDFCRKTYAKTTGKDKGAAYADRQNGGQKPHFAKITDINED